MKNEKTYKSGLFGCQSGSDPGFTLIELMIAMAVGTVIMAAIYSAYITQQRMYNAQDSVVEMQQNLRAAMLIMSMELRMAGYDPNNSGGVGVSVATANLVIFTSVADDDGLDNDNADGDGDSSTGVDEPGELKTIQYDFYDAYSDGVNDIGRQVGASASTKRALAEHIENIEFYYTMADGSQTLTPANLNNIRSMQISILARSGRQDRNFTNTTSYTTASGASWGIYNDNVRRRYLETTVNLRNMGL